MVARSSPSSSGGSDPTKCTARAGSLRAWVMWWLDWGTALMDMDFPPLWAGQDGQDLGDRAWGGTPVRESVLACEAAHRERAGTTTAREAGAAAGSAGDGQVSGLGLRPWCSAVTGAVVVTVTGPARVRGRRCAGRARRGGRFAGRGGGCCGRWGAGTAADRGHGHRDRPAGAAACGDGDGGG